MVGQVPLTPALSQRERENASPVGRQDLWPSCSQERPELLPLLLWRRGLGRGGLLHDSSISVFVLQGRFSGWLLSEFVTRRGQVRLTFQFAHDLSAASPAVKGGKGKGPPLPNPLLQRRRGGGLRRCGHRQSNSMAVGLGRGASFVAHPTASSVTAVLLAGAACLRRRPNAE